MNDNREEPAGKNALVDALLAIDSRTPSSSAEGREIAKEALRRDRRRVRVLTWTTIGCFLLAVIAICLPVYFYYLRLAPGMERCQRDLAALEQQFHKERPKDSEPDLLAMTASMTAGLGGALVSLTEVYLCGISALLAVILAAAFCTLLLITATRRATLRQIQVSLLTLSDQFDTLQRSLQGGHPTGSGQATQNPSA
jgi:hypothetical protein